MLTRGRRLIRRPPILHLLDRGLGSDIPLPEVIAHHLKPRRGRFQEARPRLAGSGAQRQPALGGPSRGDRASQRNLALLGKLKDQQVQAELELQLPGRADRLDPRRPRADIGASLLQCCERGLELNARREPSARAFPSSSASSTSANCRGDVPAATAMAEDFLQAVERGRL